MWCHPPPPAVPPTITSHRGGQGRRRLHRHGEPARREHRTAARQHHTVGSSWWNAYRGTIDAATARGFRVILGYWENGAASGGRITDRAAFTAMWPSHGLPCRPCERSPSATWPLSQPVPSAYPSDDPPGRGRPQAGRHYCETPPIMLSGGQRARAAISVKSYDLLATGGRRSHTADRAGQWRSLCRQLNDREAL
jgi:hypothetical protein